MREFLFAVVVLLGGISIGFSGGYFLATEQNKCQCECCKPNEVKPHRPLRPNGSMPGSTGSIGSIETK